MSKADDFITYATSEIGHDYVFGAEGPNDFDCSGLVQFSLGRVGITAPRTAALQQGWAKSVSKPLPGDLVFYGTPAHHVGIYLGGGKMVDAPHTGAKVRIEGVGNPTGYGRVPGLGAAVTAAAGAGAAAVSTVANVAGISPSSILSGVSAIAWEGLAAAAGVALVGFGLYRLAVKPAGHTLLSNLGRS